MPSLIFLRQQRTLTITTENNILTKSKNSASDERNCPYIHGQTVERPRCPVTNIETADVPKSDVLQDIYQETPGSIRKNPVPGECLTIIEPELTFFTGKIPEVWAESMHIQLQKKKDDGTYRNLITVNKSKPFKILLHQSINKARREHLSWKKLTKKSCILLFGKAIARMTISA